MNANLLRGKIREQGITQAKLARIIGISENSLSRKIQGKREFRLSEVCEICSCLQISNPGEIFFTHQIPNAQRFKNGEQSVKGVQE